MKLEQRLFVFSLLLCLLAIGPASAQTSNYWINTGGGQWPVAANWTNDPAGSSPPGGYADQPFFTNNVAPGSAYTVQLTNSVTSSPPNIYDDSVIFDLNGWRWDTDTSPSTTYIGTNGGPARTVTFSSSSAPQVGNGNAFNWLNFNPSVGAVVGDNQTILVNDSLGYPVTFYYPGGLNYIYGNVRVEGTNSWMHINFPNSGLGSFYINSTGVFSNQAGLSFGAGNQIRPLRGTLNFYNSYLSNTSAATPYTPIGYNSATPTYLTMQDGSVWWDGSRVIIGSTGPGRGHVLLDNSTFLGTSMEIGDASANGSSSLIIQNGSSALFSNRLVNTGWSTHTNTLVLNNGTITLGTGSVPGVLTNQSVMRAAGSIRGVGSSPALVYVGSAGAGAVSSLEIGASIGTLTLSNANLTLDTGTELLLEFSDTALDQILIRGGSASLLGSNVFSLASGAAPLGPYKYGLGAYDFVVGDSVTWNSQYDNLTNILANAGLVQGLHYNYGIFNLDGGLQALRLEFVPEPSTILLLVGGGLLLWRFRRRRG